MNTRHGVRIPLARVVAVTVLAFGVVSAPAFAERGRSSAGSPIAAYGQKELRRLSTSAARATVPYGLHIDVWGLPAGEQPDVLVTGPLGFKRHVRHQSPIVLQHLVRGAYRVALLPIMFKRSTGDGAVKGLAAEGEHETVNIGAVTRMQYAYLDYTSGRIRGNARFAQLVESGAPCVLRTDGIVRCWLGRPPAGRFIQIAGSVGLTNGPGTCGLRPNGSAVCWDGDGLFVNAGAGDVSGPHQRFKALAGNGVDCGLETNGGVSCWGLSRTLAVPIGTFSDVTALPFYNPFTPNTPVICGLRPDGSVSCGRNTMHLGAGSLRWMIGAGWRARSEAPVGLDGIRPDGTAVSFTLAADGGVTASSLLPGAQYLQLAGPCGLRSDGAAVCLSTDRSSVIITPGPFKQLAVDTGPPVDGLPELTGDIVCGLRPDGKMSCFWRDPADPHNNPTYLRAWQNAPEH